jgi:hypothetical protein
MTDRNLNTKELLWLVESLRGALRRIEELATDTPTPEDAERALDAIKRECEDVLSSAIKDVNGEP